MISTACANRKSVLLAVGPAQFSTVMDGARTPLGKALKKEALKTLRRAKYEMKRLRSARLHFSGPHGERSFTIGKQLGEGGYATIWRVHERQPDCSEVRYAVKRVVFDGAFCCFCKLRDLRTRVVLSVVLGRREG